MSYYSPHNDFSASLGLLSTILFVLLFAGKKNKKPSFSFRRGLGHLLYWCEPFAENRGAQPYLLIAGSGGLLLIGMMRPDKGSGDCDEIPMLPINSPENSESMTHNRRAHHQIFPTRSTSLNIISYEKYDQNEYNPLYSTGPIMGKSPFVPPALEKIGGKTAATKEKVSYPVTLNQRRTKNDYETKNEHLLKSGPLGKCNDPFCTTCPTYYAQQPTRRRHFKSSAALKAEE